MTYEQKLNLSLKHLAEYQKGSYMYFFEKNSENLKPNYPNDEAKDKASRLHPFLLRKEVPEEEILPIIFQLHRDGYLDIFYQENEAGQKERIAGAYPHQIKITYSGMRFIADRGYKPITIIRRYKDGILVLLGAVAGAVISGLVTLGVEYLKPTQPNTHIKVETYKCDSLKLTRDSLAISPK